MSEKYSSAQLSRPITRRYYQSKYTPKLLLCARMSMAITFPQKKKHIVWLIGLVYKTFCIQTIKQSLTRGQSTTLRSHAG